MTQPFIVRHRRWLALLALVPLVAAVVLAVVPVTVVPASSLPGWAKALLPSDLENAELSCGSVVSPFDPSKQRGLSGAVGTVLRSSCTATVRDRLWVVVWSALAGLALAAVAAVLAARARRSDRSAESP